MSATFYKLISVKPNNLLIPADKTTNYYSMNTATYEKLITENVTKTYKKSCPKVIDQLNSRSARVAKKLGLDNRIEKLAEKEAFITLKDHKPEFHDHPTCRLINPSKSEIGIISKRILDEINTTIIQKTQINQWKNTTSVLNWFNALQHKENLSFICFDVCDFYPSITDKLLTKALDFANIYRPINADEREIIFLSKQSLLFSNDCPWEKKSSASRFDIAMGSFDGAETCELVGCYLLSCLTKKYGNSIGLYRDDGLAVFNSNPQQIERIKKGFCQIFRENDLKITVEANTTKVNFLDVTLDLQSGKHYPCTKEGNIPLYVHKKSNHPPSILKNIPESINKRLSEISSDKESFDKAKETYQDALNKSGYIYNLTYRKTTPETKHRKNRPRNITWFNPPYSQNVKTKVGKCFLTLIGKHFPKSHPLRRIFNRNTLKISYSCMSNVKTIISNQNKAVINKSSNPPAQTINTCNCRDKRSCPLDGKCNVRNIIYQAEVTTSQSKQTYIGLCDTSFKSRYRNHTCSFRNERYRNSTELSKYV